MALGRADCRPLLWPSGAASPPALCRSRLQSSPEPTLVMKGSGSVKSGGAGRGKGVKEEQLPREGPFLYSQVLLTFYTGMR